MQIAFDKEELASQLRSSLLDFTQYFYPIIESRDFIVSQPVGRESHHITIARALTQAARLEIPNHRLLINVSPGSGKSLMLCMWVAWTLAKYPDSKYIYVSYSEFISSKQTEFIKRLIQLEEYQYLFDVHIRKDSKAKSYFQTTAGGAVLAAGSAGTITGFDAGAPGLDRFSGALICDDLIKPDEASSEIVRQSVIDNFSQTLLQRKRGVNVPIVVIGQRVHEADICDHLIRGGDGYDWHKIIIKSIDEAGNALYPEVNPLSELLIKKATSPYVYNSQYQQEPTPASGSLYNPEWFVLLDTEPDILYSFIVCDTAETSKSYNDASVFSYVGVYEILTMGRATGQFGIHWIDCVELRVEPKDLKDAFLDFWQQCMLHRKPPQMAAIEKKSTGVTLISLLEEIRAIRVIDIPRTRESGSKTKRFLDVQPLIAERRISLPTYGKHTKMCLEHMAKITANETHRHDDIADTLADAIRLALIDKSIVMSHVKPTNYEEMGKDIMSHGSNLARLRKLAYQR